MSKVKTWAILLGIETLLFGAAIFIARLLAIPPAPGRGFVPFWYTFGFLAICILVGHVIVIWKGRN